MASASCSQGAPRLLSLRCPGLSMPICCPARATINEVCRGLGRLLNDASPSARLERLLVGPPFAGIVRTQGGRPAHRARRPTKKKERFHQYFRPGRGHTATGTPPSTLVRHPCLPRPRFRVLTGSGDAPELPPPSGPFKSVKKTKDFIGQPRDPPHVGQRRDHDVRRSRIRPNLDLPSLHAGYSPKESLGHHC